MTAEDLRRIGERLGWPWDRLAEAEAALLVARQFAVLAQIEGDVEDRRVAEFELREAIQKREHEREMVGNAFLTMFRCALETGPHELFGLLMRFAVEANWRAGLEEYMSRKAGTGMQVLDMLTELERRVDDLEWAVAKLEKSNATA